MNLIKMSSETETKNESISASATESIITKLPKDALENVKGFLQEKRTPISIIVDPKYYTFYFEITKYKDGFKLVQYSSTDGNRANVMLSPTKHISLTLFFQTKKALIKYVCKACKHIRYDDIYRSEEIVISSCNIENKIDIEEPDYQFVLNQELEEYIDILEDTYILETK